MIEDVVDFVRYTSGLEEMNHKCIVRRMRLPLQGDQLSTECKRSGTVPEPEFLVNCGLE